MPFETAISLIKSAANIILFIIDRLQQIKLSENLVSRILESVEHLQSTIKKIEPYLKKDSDTEEIGCFLGHLENAYKSCSGISEKHKVVKFAKAPGCLIKLHTIEAEIKMANSKLLLFIAANNLTMHCKSADFQNNKLKKIFALQQNSMAGLSIVEDKSIRRPPAPPGFNIQGCKNKFMLSWKPSGGIVDKYEICYDEDDDDCSFLVDGECTNVEIESPWVQPGNVYAMKVRGINKGGKGEWSNTVVGQFTKPFPQKPEISDLFLRSTTAVVTVNIPGVICSTESPVTCVEISYVSATSSKLTSSKFKIEPLAAIESSIRIFNIKKLCPDCRYNFRVKTENAEGWSKPSNLREGDTLPLPPEPNKPKSPAIQFYTPTSIGLSVKVPKNTCSKKSPIIAWKLFGYSADSEEIIRHYDRCYLLNEDDFTKESKSFVVADLIPSQKYTLQVMAQNENGWSEPSDKFEIHIAMPSTPRNVRISSNRTHSQIKIRWTKPDSALITHYEIMRRTKKGDYSNSKLVKAPAKKFSATFTKLDHNTYYYFKIRTCNGLNASAWSNEIETNTRIHKGIKAALSPAVWAIGAVASPILTPIRAGVVAGKVGNQASGKTAAVAAGTAASIGGAALGIVGAPIVAAAYAHEFVHGTDELSDQSDDEDAVIIEC